MTILAILTLSLLVSLPSTSLTRTGFKKRHSYSWQAITSSTFHWKTWETAVMDFLKGRDCRSTLDITKIAVNASYITSLTFPAAHSTLTILSVDVSLALQRFGQLYCFSNDFSRLDITIQTFITYAFSISSFFSYLLFFLRPGWHLAYLTYLFSPFQLCLSPNLLFLLVLEWKHASNDNATLQWASSAWGACSMPCFINI